MEFEMEFDLEELEGIFKVPPTPAPKAKGYMIVVKLTANQRSVISLCKAALVREFGRKEASRYITYKEDTDERDLQVWLQYQIERSAYPETYTLITAAQRWLDANPPSPTS